MAPGDFRVGTLLTSRYRCDHPTEETRFLNFVSTLAGFFGGEPLLGLDGGRRRGVAGGQRCTAGGAATATERYYAPRFVDDAVTLA